MDITARSSPSGIPTNIFAFLFGVAFQYFTIKPMRGLSPVQGLVQAVKADSLSLTAWQVGMYGFMAIAGFVIFVYVWPHSIEPKMPQFWFMMQIAMLFGFVTSYPANWAMKRHQGENVGKTIKALVDRSNPFRNAVSGL